MSRKTLSLLLLATAYLAGCATPPTQTPPPGQAAGTAPKKGGYYLDDGPGDHPPADLAAIPDATPRAEPLHRFANRPYAALGRQYVPDVSEAPYKARGLASWYGRRYHGKPTASGETYDMYAMTAAHPTLPIPSYVRVTNPNNGRSVVVRINDRGPFLHGRLIDLSYTAAWKLDILRGVSPVEVERLFPGALETTPLPQAARPEPVAIAQAELPGPQAAAGGRDLPPGIYLQLGAFASQAAADDLVARLGQRLGDAVPRVFRIASGGLHKVQAGPYADAAAAERAAAAIQEAFGIRPYKVLGQRQGTNPRRG